MEMWAKIMKEWVPSEETATASNTQKPFNPRRCNER